MKSVLDAWALVAFLHDEPGADRVRMALEQGAAASWINLGEVLYIESRLHGAEPASRAVDGLAKQLVLAEEPDSELVRSAARVKAENSLSYADAFAVATAERYDLPLLSGDPEIIGLGSMGLAVIDLSSEP